MPTPDPRPVLLVDMGGVFFAYSFARALDAWAAASGADRAEIGRRWLIDPPFDAFERGDIDPAGYFEHLRSLLGLRLDDTRLAAGWNSIYGDVDEDLVRLLRSAEVRARFRGIAGVSNTNSVHAGFWRRLYRDQLPVLDTVHCSHEMGTAKPEPEFFDRVAARHGVGRGSLVLVDDIPVVVDAARALGMRAHLYAGTSGLAGFLAAL
ncbi:HAD-IA family hydrolase [Amycolatopsis sp. NPDC004079]|uniref:HAD-IA family hydrolase n=1 Tax=Amycolatopsis sp. NPDC004079 TaxID=3154549 RepID=UPI0033B450BD